ncbi:hydroxymethylbilane synthase [Listeria booriae]|uniref:Porphobilinogen deaminase n=1 Tax=Listeria booriae TaxID=1552123 RepID=A0A842B2S2_9LIST|nr:hydroxymethylbilane synthase [Listeria booriae]MBC1796578.1 hydroxymethylbilane synthase [Listeria booriae]MBC1799841.1 hydroxymethylbilane synthase [Listeria booriae]MBC2189371.1 hydroxymethylbilane synthase [Listeria booriae]
MTRKIIVGSRRSQLALTQTKWVISKLQAQFPEVTFEIEEIVTKGDRILDVTLSKVGGKGLFVSEVEDALLDKRIDFAVHSMKDVPSELAAGLVIGAIPKRENPLDCLIFKTATDLENLPEGAIVGTSSLRRAAQLLHIRPDLQMKPIRGNIDTRLRKLQEEDFDAIVLAVAGLKRMDWLDKLQHPYVFLDEQTCLPAVGQGALAIECRYGDNFVQEMLQTLQDDETSNAVIAERTLLKALDGGCEIPIAGYATIKNNEITLKGIVSSVDGQICHQIKESGQNPHELGLKVAQKLIDLGAKEIIQGLRNNG